MERNRRVPGIILMLGTIMPAVLGTGCSYHETADAEKEIRISFSCGSTQTRALDPNENRISDISIMIFDENGTAEEARWIRDGNTQCSSRLMKGRKYIICACANFGYQVYADDIGELDEIIYHLAYPDEYRQGIPMYAYQEFTVDDDCEEVSVELERLMAKISLKVDRSRLSDDVEMFVRSVKIGNCPRNVSVFRPSRAEGRDDCFPSGFSRIGFETDNLNITSESGMSDAISLYMLENMQGRLENTIYEDSEKIFSKDDPRSEVCSYIEMELDYLSSRHYSTGRGLIYRFYLGEDRNGLNVERNCHYRITVTPEDDGLSDDGWRVDKRNLSEYGPPYFAAYPSDYIVGDIGDKIHIWCEFSPSNAPFDVGISYMEDDKAEGIYDYVIDEDGHGATLTLTGPGRGLIYMEAGEPVDEAALFIIEVNLP